jgi:nucleoid-associated protein YgaU
LRRPYYSIVGVFLLLALAGCGGRLAQVMDQRLARIDAQMIALREQTTQVEEKAIEAKREALKAEEQAREAKSIAQAIQDNLIRLETTIEKVIEEATKTSEEVNTLKVELTETSKMIRTIEPDILARAQAIEAQISERLEKKLKALESQENQVALSKQERSPEGRGGPEPARCSKVIQYKVQPGDTLRKIAHRYYHNEDRWVEIFEANKDKIHNPTLIYPGQVLIIPVE